jgi:hypothetical protein
MVLRRDLTEKKPSGVQQVLKIILFVLQALLALSAVAIGLAMIAWVVYNTFIERMPQYTGGFMTLGIAPLMLTFGVGWLYALFRGKRDR